MSYRGHVKNGVVVLDGDASLPEGVEVVIEPIEAEDIATEQPPTLLERVWEGEDELAPGWGSFSPPLITGGVRKGSGIPFTKISIRLTMNGRKNEEDLGSISRV